MTRLLELYPSDPAAGSPFGTGDNFTFTPEYKRMAALQGDLLFIAPRRLLTQTLAGRQAVYSYRACFKSSPPALCPHMMLIGPWLYVQWVTNMASKDWELYGLPPPQYRSFTY